jgi:hypothetical protein
MVAPELTQISYGKKRKRETERQGGREIEQAEVAA